MSIFQSATKTRFIFSVLPICSLLGKSCVPLSSNSGCKSDMWNCLDCEFFIPDADQLSFYEEQAILWRVKCDRFTDFPIIKGNAERNAELFERVLKKLKEVRHLS